MHRKLIVTCSCAALVLAARAYAGDDKGTSGAKGTDAGAAARPSEDTGTRPGGPGMLPDPIEGDQAQPAKGTEQTVIGTVRKVAQEKLTVQTSPLSDPHELTLGSDTRYLREGREISRDQIQEGDMVRATFTGEGDSGRATEIRVIPGAGRAGEAERQQPGASGTSAPGSAAPPAKGSEAGTQR
jgi:hypothetical protein